MAKTIRQYGTWSSPITPRALSDKFHLSDVQWSDDGDTLVWLEGRGKQSVLVTQHGLQAPRDLNVNASVRGGIGYGGGEFTLSRDSVFFAGGDGRLYGQPLSAGAERPITPAFGRLASPAVSPDGQWVAFVHSYEDADSLALVDSAGEIWPRKLVSGDDFYMQQAWHPSGRQLAYVAWNKPNMPWDGTELRLASLETDTNGVPYVASNQTLAGAERTAIFQPAFSPDGRWLAYVSDAAGWTQLYLYDLANGTHTRLTAAEAEFGTPAWVQGLRTYGWTHNSRALYAIRGDSGFSSLWHIDVPTGDAARVPGLGDYTHVQQIAVSPVRDALALIASSGLVTERVISLEPEAPDLPDQLSDAPGLMISIKTGRGLLIHKRSSPETLTADQLARPEAIEWPTDDGETAHGLYYAPASDRFTGVGLPPLIVYVHGGPTSQARAAYSPNAQFFATRGYAFLEVNHRGSTGYGRAYQDKLYGGWGVYDVDDSIGGAQALVSRGLADASKLVIMGGSAGGYTVLMSLIRKPGFYRAGICAYGISNQFTLATEAGFKFEAHYSDTLLGPLPEAADLYRQRSPVFSADKITDPVLIFQGSEDEVVPPAQVEEIVAALRARRVPHEYHLFEGEGHGWRKPDTIEAYYTIILRFLRQHVIYV